MENATLDTIYQELKYLHKKMDQLEQIMVPEVKMTKEDKQELKEAITEYKTGKTARFKDIKQD